MTAKIFNLFIVLGLILSVTKSFAQNQRPGEVKGQQMTFNSINEGFRIIVKQTSKPGSVVIQLLDVDFSGSKSTVIREISRFKAKYQQTQFASELTGYYLSEDKKSILTVFKGKNQVYGASLHIKRKKFSSYTDIFKDKRAFTFSSDLFQSRYRPTKVKQNESKCLKAFS